MSLFQDSVLTPMDNGIAGKNVGIPLPLPGLGRVLNNIQRRTYTLLGGQSGCGKTGFVDYCYVFAPYVWYKKHKDDSDVKLRIIYRSMERSAEYKHQKFTCMLMYFRHGILMDIPTLNGWEGKLFTIDVKTRKQIMECDKFITDMFTDGVIDLIDGPENPTGIYKNIKETALKLGKYDETIRTNEEGGQWTESTYKPYSKNLYLLGIYDHIGRCKLEGRDGKLFTRKQNLDKFSEYLQATRDKFGMTHIAISQFNRALSSDMRMRNKALGPEPDDFKDSGNMYEDADIAMGLYNPYKLKDFDHLGYSVKEFVNKYGFNRFRSLTVLKNTFGVDDVSKGLYFKGENGLFSELPMPSETAKLAKLYQQVAAGN